MHLSVNIYDINDGEWKDVEFDNVEGYEFVDNFFIVILTDGARHGIKSENVNNFELTPIQEEI